MSLSKINWKYRMNNTRIDRLISSSLHWFHYWGTLIIISSLAMLLIIASQIKVAIHVNIPCIILNKKLANYNILRVDNKVLNQLLLISKGSLNYEEIIENCELVNARCKGKLIVFTGSNKNDKKLALFKSSSQLMNIGNEKIRINIFKISLAKAILLKYKTASVFENTN